MAKRPKETDDDVAALTVRVPRALVSVIDHERKTRAVRVPRNTWILEAVVEKLDREKNVLRNSTGRGADDGRSDLLISLVKVGASGHSRNAHAAAEAIIAEEKAKNHNVLADRLTKALHVNGNGNGHAAPAILGANVGRQREFLLDLTPKKRIEDLVLSEMNRRACEELIEEQHRASVLRAHSLEPRHRVLLSGPPGNGKTSLLSRF